jgi:hypothetical protein
MCTGSLPMLPQSGVLHRGSAAGLFLEIDIGTLVGGHRVQFFDGLGMVGRDAAGKRSDIETLRY